MSKSPMVLGAVVFPGFEMLDLFGPLEMFSGLGQAKMKICVIAEHAGPVPAAIFMDGPVGPSIVAEVDFASAPRLDVLLLPGGIGILEQLDNPAMLTFLAARKTDTQVVASVCNGSALFARAGLLDGHRATSNKQFFAMSVAQSDKVTWVEAARWVDDGPVVTSSGVSAGMDMALALIERLFDAETAERIAVQTEYSRHTDAQRDPFVAHLNAMT